MKLRLDAFKRAIEKVYAFYMRRYGFSSYYFTYFKNAQKAAYRDSTYSKADRKWTKDRGFFPWRIQQYGLSEENYKSFISDDDYYYLYPLNNSYSKWVDDKLTTRYVLAPFSRFLPEYYYHIADDKRILRLMDCPPGCDNTIEGIVDLLKEKKVLASKAAMGSEGMAFFKFEYRDNTFYINREAKTQDEMIRFLDTSSDLIITEYLEMHPDIRKLNPESVNTLRIMVINEHGDDPVIPYVYLRIGTKKSGTVDNVGHGGMVCKVDPETGRFYGAESLSNHVFHKEEVHPDTKERLEGFLPHWELVKDTIIQIAKYIPELRYLGYDVAITPDGFKIVEINSHQSLHKAAEYPPEVNRFLFDELKKKKRKYGRK